MLCVVYEVGGCMKDIYNKYKYDYENYILLIKSGNFYICLNKDAFVISNVMNYKIVDSKSYVKVGFPISSLEKVISTLENKYINYVVINKELVSKKKFKVNNFKKYSDKNDYYIIFNRINRINQVLHDNINNNHMNDILDQVEKIICKINF